MYPARAMQRAADGGGVRHGSGCAQKVRCELQHTENCGTEPDAEADQKTTCSDSPALHLPPTDWKHARSPEVQYKSGTSRQVFLR